MPLPVYTSDGFVPRWTGYGPNMQQFVRLATAPELERETQEVLEAKRAEGWPDRLRPASAGQPHQ